MLLSKYLTLFALFLLYVSCSGPVETPRAEVAHPVSGQVAVVFPDNFGVEQLDNTKGLSNSSVNCIFQDSQHLLWIGTWDGLNRYDGSGFRIFRSAPGQADALSNQVILKIGEDRHGAIWLLTMHGINRYDKTTDRFTPYYFSRKEKPPVSESEFNMALNASGEVFCAVKEWGIGYFDGKDFRHIPGDFPFAGAIRKMEFSGDGRLFLLTDDGRLLSLLFENSGSGRKVASVTYIMSGVQHFGLYGDGRICTVKADGTTQLLDNSGTVQMVLPEKCDNLIARIPEGLIVSTRSGYRLIDAFGKSSSPAWLATFGRQKLMTLLRGSENLIWAGTDGDGVYKVFPQQRPFQVVTRQQLPELDGAIVRAFVESGDDFWVATKGKGVLKLPRSAFLADDMTLKATVFNRANSGMDNAAYALCNGKDDLVFIGTDGPGLSVFDKRSGRMLHWDAVSGSKEVDFFRSVYAIYQDLNGDLWLGTNGFGIVRCAVRRNPGGGLTLSGFRRFTASGTDALSSNIVFAIVPKNENELWIGTRLGGLNLLDKTSGKFRSFKNDPADARSLSSNDILCLVNDAAGKLWIGTSFGLNRFEGFTADGKARFQSFTTTDGLPDNTVHGIVSDKASNLWVSTNFGLSNFIVRSGKFLNYTKNDGLQNNEFADGAFHSDARSGLIFMGGIKGFNYFQPQSIRESGQIPDLLIDRISGQNQDEPYFQGLVLSPEAKGSPSIVLQHNQNFFDVKLSALTFTNNDKCRYAYELAGFDKGWKNIDNRKIISFTNVPPGNYALNVKWSNADGVWTRPVRAMDLRIRPVWWQSQVAFAIYIVLGIGLIALIVSYNRKRQSLRQNILIRKKEEELHETRLEFFTNVAHEFLTPLTLILGPIQKLSDMPDLNEGNRKFIRLIQRNSSRLLFLTKQLLDFRKAEHEYLEVSAKQFDLISLSEQIAELFDTWALEKKIDYQLEIPTKLKGWFDKDKVEKILFNLLSNAFKYTPDKGWIRFGLELKVQADGAVLLIRIRNSGPGIPKEKLESLFSRFFLAEANPQEDPEMFRTGIGLAYIKKLVTVLRGEIRVSSVPDEETCFTISIPCSEAAFTEKELDRAATPVLLSRHLRNILDEREEADPEPEKMRWLEQLERQRKKILVVEDEREIHAFLKDLLSEKYTLVSAYNGVEALDYLDRELPDLIISDVMMPEMDGVELCRRVKTDVRTCHIPLIMLTAKDSVIHRIEGLESGANSYIPKPFYPDHLLVRIQKLLEEKELILRHFTQDSAVEELTNLTVGNESKDFIRAVIGVIRRNIDSENLQSALIEKELGISNSQLYRRTKEVFGLSPGDLIRTIRLKHAAELLRRNQITVSEVCYKSGFNNRSYFYREFNKMYGTTPKSYQLQYKSRTVSFSNN